MQTDMSPDYVQSLAAECLIVYQGGLSAELLEARLHVRRQATLHTMGC